MIELGVFQNVNWGAVAGKIQKFIGSSADLLENHKPVEAASRAYYAAYQMVTAVLIKMKLSPRDEFGNWSHLDTQEMYRIHICQKDDLGYKEKVALGNLRLSFRTLFINRSQAIMVLPRISLWLYLMSIGERPAG